MGGQKDGPPDAEQCSAFLRAAYPDASYEQPPAHDFQKFVNLPASPRQPETPLCWGCYLRPGQICGRWWCPESLDTSSRAAHGGRWLLIQLVATTVPVGEGVPRERRLCIVYIVVERIFRNLRDLQKKAQRLGRQIQPARRTSAPKSWISLPIPGVCSGRARPDQKHAWCFDPCAPARTPKWGSASVVRGPGRPLRAEMPRLGRREMHTGAGCVHPERKAIRSERKSSQALSWVHRG